MLIAGPGLAQSPGWFRSFSGTIGKYPITLHLAKTGRTYSGSYYYQSTEDPISLSGEDSTAGKDSIRLLAILPDRESEEIFTFQLKGQSLKGSWLSSGNKRLPFSATESVGDLVWGFVFTQGAAPLRPRLSNSPAASFLAAAPWPKGNSPLDEFLKQLIRKEFGWGGKKEEIGKIFLRQKQEFFNEYRKELEDQKDEDLKEAVSLNYDVSSRVEVFYQRKKLLVLADYSYSYSGGVHGNYGASYTPIDLDSKKVLSLDDILRPEGQSHLARLLEVYFRRIYRLNPTDSLTAGGLFENHIEPGDNFYVTAKGIAFSYVPYEIGPWAMGQIEIFIPFTELAGQLQPAFRKMIE